MSVRMKLTHSKTRSRRAHHGVAAPRLTRDTKTGSIHRRHFADPQTGFYRGRQIIDVAGRTAKKAAKQETRAQVAQIAAPESDAKDSKEKKAKK